MATPARAERLRGDLVGAGCEALLVTELANVRYLTGFSGSAGMVLVLPDEQVLLTDGRYATQAADQLAAAGLGDAGAPVRLIIGTQAGQRDGLMAATAGLGRLGLEAGSVSWAQQRRMAGEWFASIELVATEGLVERLRGCKDNGELARLERAARIADEALAAVLPLLASGPSEAAFALALEIAMREGGAEAISFDTIVAAGPNGAEPHHQPTSRTIGAGELVTIDFGAMVDGYHSDMTRTVCVGRPATAELARMESVVREAQAAGVAAVGPGRPAADIDRVCREVIEAAGLGPAFVHPTGHGVGLHIHEAPAVSAASADTLEAGQVVTVEPGIYIPGVGGVRIEDTVVVTASGCRPITAAPKDLTIVTEDEMHAPGQGT